MLYDSRSRLPTCTMNICHNLVHKPVRICTYAHAHSRRDRATPIAHLVEIKHNVYMRAVHSRDAYAYTARLDHRCHPRLVHMTYHSRDRTVSCVRNSSRFACSYYSLDSCICQL